MTGLIVSGTYFVIVIISSIILNSDQIKYSMCSNNNSKKISISNIVLISFMFTIFNIIGTINENGLKGDRLQYYRDFNGREIDSLLSKVIELIHYFSGSFETLLYSTTFICCLLMLFAYRINTSMNASSFILFLLSDSIIYTYIRLKQAYANAFIILAFALIFSKLNLKKFFLLALFIILGCSFHPSAYIMIPLSIFLILQKKRNINLLISSIIIIAILIFFEPIMTALASFLAPYNSSLSNKISEYFIDESAVSREGNFGLILKGALSFFAVIIGLLKRKNYKYDIDNYDLYLTVSLVSSMFLIISLNSYWMKRFSSLFIFVICDFCIKLIFNEKNDKLRTIEYIFVFSFSFLILVRYFILSYINYGCLI